MSRRAGRCLKTAKGLSGTRVSAIGGAIVKRVLITAGQRLFACHNAMRASVGADGAGRTRIGARELRLCLGIDGEVPARASARSAKSGTLRPLVEQEILARRCERHSEARIAVLRCSRKSCLRPPYIRR